MSREIAEHLRYFAEMGVDGVSKDVKWRQRAMVSATIAEICHRSTVGPISGNFCDGV